MGAPAPGLLNYSSAHRYLMDTVVHAWPEMKWLRPLAFTTSLLALGADVAISRHFARQPKGSHEIDLQEQLAELYRREADKLAGHAVAQSTSAAQAQSIVQVNLGAPAPQAAAPMLATSRQTSRYLMEEGNQNVDTDCFSCASAHLAGMEGGLTRAQHAAEREGECGPECQSWLHFAVQEPSALLARDWTPERVARYPQEQQDLIGRLTPQIRDVQRRIVGGDQRQALVDATWELKEASRFTQSGDPLEHPQVDARLAAAEEHLVTGERLRVGTFDPETATALRRLRQAVSNDVTSPDALVQVADRADDVSRQANAPVYQQMRPQDLAAMADQVKALRADFLSERRRLGGDGYHALLPKMPDRPAPGGARVSRSTIERFTLPTASEAAAVTEPTSISALTANLNRHLEERGTRVVTRNLESTAEGSLEGYYDPDTSNITLSTAVGTQETPYAYEVRVHEAAHSLLDNSACNPRPSLSHDREEERAELATVAAMTELGLPVELHDGTILPPGSRQVDWEDISRFDPGLARDARWASDWISAAARGEHGYLALEICPALRG